MYAFYFVLKRIIEEMIQRQLRNILENGIF